MTLNELAQEVHANAKSKGFYEEGTINVPEKLCLIHSEVSECLEADRKGRYARDLTGRLKDIENSYNSSVTKEQKDEDFRRVFMDRVKDSFEDELADVVIRVLDLAAAKGIDLDFHIRAKMRYNSMREYKHGKKY